MKVKNSYLLILFIIIFLLFIILFFLFNKTSKNSNIDTNISTTNNIVEHNSIPDKVPSNNKFAFTIDHQFSSNYVLTLDLDFPINLPNDFLLYNEENYKDFHFDFTSNRDCTITLNSVTIDVINRNLDFESSYLTIVEQVDNWYLVYNNLRDKYNIYLKINNNITPDYLMFTVTDANKNDVTIDNFNKLISLVNVYRLQSDESTLYAYNLNNDLIDLSDYIFVKEKIADSLKLYGLHLKTPQTIFSLYDNEVEYYADIISDTSPFDSYKIDILSDEEYTSLKDNINQKPDLVTRKNFEYNNHSYEICSLYLTEYSSHVYIIEKLSSNSYLCISKYFDSNFSIDTIISMFENDLL